MSIVNHHSQGLFHYLRVEKLIKIRSSLGTFFKDTNESMHATEAKFHQLWLFMLHGKYHRQNYIVKSSWVEGK